MKTSDPATTDGLEVRELTIAFGGNVAVNSVSFTAPRGRITGLIGPNGAGKTTTFNGCSGLLRPASGSVHLFGRDVTAWGPARRARLGLGRTFQRMELCQAMTVAENIALGREALEVGGNPLRQVLVARSQRRAIAAATEEALELCGLTPIAGQMVSTLSTGQGRLVELARALAGGFRLLLLDEPSSGLDDDETRRFGEILTSVVDQRALGILLVEHDMELVMTICDYLYVLDFGTPIFQGTPSETQASAIVRSAYLGESDEAIDGALSEVGGR